MSLKNLFVAFGAVALAISASAVQAGPLFDAFTEPDGASDLILDDSQSRVIDGDGNPGLIGAGDIIQGMLRFTSSLSTGFTPGASEQLVIFFTAQVTQVLKPGDLGYPLDSTSDVYFKLGAVDQANANSLESLLDNQIDGSIDTTGAIFAVLESKGAQVNPANGGAGGAPLTPAAALAAFNDPTKYLLDIVGGLVNPDDFMEASMISDSIATLLGKPVNAGIGLEAGGFTSIINNTGFPLAETEDSLHLDNDTVTRHEFSLSGRLIRPRGNAFTAGWQISDNASVTLNPIPEPGSMALAGLGIAGLAAFARKRRNNKLAA